MDGRIMRKLNNEERELVEEFAGILSLKYSSSSDVVLNFYSRVQALTKKFNEVCGNEALIPAVVMLK